uniref:SID1 transmembrane family member 2 n=1 Tax=Callorhinchus milii TaxID=7868 RepID=A0A4W3IES9_CALMI
MYEFPQDVDSVIIKVVSEKAYPCCVVSVQDIVCPVYDLDHNVEFTGVYQTMTKTSAITVQKKDFPGGKFYTVLVIKPEDYACGGSIPFYLIRGKGNYTENQERIKQLQLTIVPSISETVYIQVILFCFFIFFSFYVGALLVAFVHYIRFHQTNLNGADEGVGTMSATHPITFGAPEGGSYGAIEESSPDVASQINSPLDVDHCSVQGEDNFDTEHDIEFDKEMFKSKTFLFVSDLSRKDNKTVSRKYNIYFWNITTIAVFYALPVIQLVITYQTCLQQHSKQHWIRDAGISVFPDCIKKRHPL